MNERLKSARKLAGYSSASEAAAAMGIAIGTYAGHENGNRAFDVETAKRYAKFFKVALTWLLTGEGPMKTTMREEEARQENPIAIADKRRALVDDFDPDAPDETVSDELVYTTAKPYEPRLPGARPEIDVRLGAGHGTVGETYVATVGDMNYTGHRVIGEWVFPEGFSKNELRAATNAIVIHEVTGDSMSGTLNPGDRAIVDTSQTRLAQDGIYSFDDGDGEPRVKRLQKVLFSDPQMIHVISDNPAHTTQIVELSRVKIIGRVVGKVSRI
jgi:phage repressor protein C with HTH and peptisase S24 domain